MAKYFGHQPGYKQPTGQGTGSMRMWNHPSPAPYGMRGTGGPIAPQASPMPRNGYAGRYYGGGLYSSTINAAAERAGAMSPAARAGYMKMLQRVNPALWMALAYQLGLWAGNQLGGWFTAQSAVPADSYDFVGAGYTLCCQVAPNPLLPVRKIREVSGTINPPVCQGWTVCGTDDGTAANKNNGAALSATATRVEVKMDNVAWPNPFGFALQKWSRLSSQTGLAPVYYPSGRPARVIPVLPAPLEMPWASERNYPKGRARSGRSRPMPYQMPAVQWDFGGKKPVKTPVALHDNLPPRRGVKEEKFKIGKGGLAGDLYGMLSEIGDIVGCVEKNIKKGLPPEQRRFRGGSGMHDRVADASRNLRDGRVDIPGLVMCLIGNHVEDKVIGKANKAASDAYFGSPYAPKAARGPGLSFGFRMR